MSYIFFGMCTLLIGTIIFRKNSFRITDKTKELLYNMGIYNQPNIKNISNIETVIYDMIEIIEQKKKKEKLVTELCRMSDKRKKRKVFEELLRNREAKKTMTWYDKLLILGGYELVDFEENLSPY